MIQLEQIHFHYPNQTRLLADFSYQFKPGKVYGLAGPNGSGKTSLLKIMAKLLRPQQGTILGNESISLFLPKSLGYLDLTLSENFAFFSKLYQQVISNQLAYFDLEKVKNQPLKKLSLGQQVRWGLLRTLLKPAEWYLLDEPFNGLDEMANQLVLKQIQAKQKEAAGFIIATHQTEKIDQVVDEWIQF